MRNHIITPAEKLEIEKYLRQDGARTSTVRALVTRAKRSVPVIEDEIRLLRRLVERYKIEVRNR
jgi:hypothetical protein